VRRPAARTLRIDNRRHGKEDSEMNDRSADTTLAAWQAREAELNARSTHHGLARPEQFAGRSGIEVFEAMLAGEIPRAPICDTLDFMLVEARPGHVEFQGRPRQAHYNPLGSVHGGWIATLLDSAVACAVHSLLPAGKVYTTLELKVNYVKALSERVPLVRAIGDIIFNGGRIGTSEGKLVGPDGTLYAHATTTCLIMETR
jgi:uncharacterized protein (TIGR00369 family)